MQDVSKRGGGDMNEGKDYLSSAIKEESLQVEILMKATAKQEYLNLLKLEEDDRELIRIAKTGICPNCGYDNVIYKCKFKVCGFDEGGYSIHKIHCKKCKFMTRIIR